MSKSILKALIIDDEPLAHKVVSTYVNDIPFVEIVGQCYLATEALSILQQQEIDLIFLDIQMPKLKGLDFLRTLSRRPIVIITSAFEEYALESFELDVCDYLLKPFRFDRFLKAVNKAQEIFHFKNSAAPKMGSRETASLQETNQIFIKADKRLIQIDLKDIFYLESYGNYVKIWVNKKHHLTARTLSSFEEQLSDQQFFRIHKSYIINKSHIQYMEGNFVMMKNDQQLPIGKNNRQAFKRFIGS